MNNLFHKILFCYFLIVNTLLFSQVTSLEFERISIDQGLSNNSINSVLQTSDGFLWIATKDGLNRFDGKTFRVYKSDLLDSTSLPQNYIMSLYEDSNNILWIGTWGGGLCKYNPEKENFFSFNLPAKFDDYIQCIYEDDLESLWFGTPEGGLYNLNLNDEKVTNYSLRSNNEIKLPANNITAIVKIDDFLWVGTWDKGLYQLNLKKFTYERYSFKSNAENFVSSDLIWDIYQKSDSLFLLSTESGIVEFNFINKSFKKYLNGNTFRQIICDTKGRIWAGTYNYQGIYLFKNDEIVNSDYNILTYADDDPFTLTSNRVRWIYEDKLKNIWIGTEDGLNKLPLKKDFLQYKYFPIRNSSIGGRVVSSIYEGKNRILWVGYGGGGFDKIDLKNNNISHFENNPNDKNSLNSNDVVSLFEDDEGILWIGTSYGGLNKYDPKLNKYISYTRNSEDESSIKSNWVHQINELNSDQLLIGTNESLEIFDRKKEKFSRFSPKLNSMEVTLPDTLSVNSLLIDSKNNIWIGTWLDGLYKYDNKSKTISHFMPIPGNSKSISSNKITSIYEDSQKRIWVGTHSGGLNELDVVEGIFVHYTTHNGLPNDVVFGILEDDNNALWISTMKGLVKFNPENKHFRIYDKSEGIINNQFNWRAYFKNSSGTIYFGGINGFVSFNPISIEQDSIAMPVKFISFKVNNKERQNSELLQKNKGIELDYYENFFSIEFLVLDFNPSLKHNYLYMLKGLNNEWIQSGSINLASYTDVNPGEYNFLVKASSADGIWSDISELEIIIKPAWWMTWWFRILLIFTIGVIAFFIYKYRINQLLKIERIRLNISRDLHDEIGSNLSSICVESQVLMENPQIMASEREHLSIIKKTSIETMQAMRDIIWFINPENEWSGDLLLKMREAAANSLIEIDWVFNAPKELNLSGLNLEAKRNIFLIYKEVLTNVAKHSKAKSCKIELITQPKLIQMSIIDDGVGFDYDSIKRKSGIINIQKRAEQISAKTEIISSNGNGTKILFLMKK